MAISAQQLTIYLYSAHRAVIFAIAQLSCSYNYCRTHTPSHIYAHIIIHQRYRETD